MRKKSIDKKKFEKLYREVAGALLCEFLEDYLQENYLEIIDSALIKYDSKLLPSEKEHRMLINLSAMIDKKLLKQLKKGIK